MGAVIGVVISSVIGVVMGVVIVVVMGVVIGVVMGAVIGVVMGAVMGVVMGAFTCGDGTSKHEHERDHVVSGACRESARAVATRWGCCCEL